MYDIDLHAHTRFFHSFPGRPTAYDPIGAELLGRVASARGMDAVATTNHDYYEEFEHDDVTFIPGIEITTTRGHVLVVGPDPPEGTAPGELRPEEAVDLARDHDCAVILPHPFRDSTVRHSDATFDAFELNGKHADTHTRVRPMADDRSIPMTGGSDAHFPFEVGRAYTRVDADELTPESVADAIRDGRVEPVYQGSAIDRVLSPIYKLIHQGKGHRAPPDVNIEEGGDGGAPRSDS